MLIARVIGTTVSTIKDEKLSGRKLLIVRQTDVGNRTFDMGGGLGVVMPTGWGVAMGQWQWTIISGYVEQTSSVFIGNSVRVI